MAEGSDVDVLVRFSEQTRIGLFEYVAFRNRLCEALGNRVDLVTEDS